MNKLLIISILYIILGISLTGCKKHTSKNAVLWSEMESLMNNYPDSVLRFLQHHVSVESLNHADRMRYNLLLTQAIDKNYIYHTSDSVMKMVTDYYESTKASLDLQMKSHYIGIATCGERV